MGGNQIIGDDSSVDEMLTDDALENRRIAFLVPRAFRIDHGNRSAGADAKAVRFRAKDAPLFGEPELLQSPLQEFPCGLAPFELAAFRLRLLAAEEDVPSGYGDADRGRDRLQRVR